jgi:hypothetical protein
MKSMKQDSTKKSIKNVLMNCLFAFVCLIILIFLFAAPEETTSKLPNNSIHAEFHQIKSKKEADRLCVACHADGKEAPLPEDHPAPFRCLFCHKREPM